jgi:cytosine/adenosine deaminase-related metal-dependent hydrolase
MKADLLLSGGTIITVDATRSVIEDGAIAISGDSIVAIGPRGYVTRAHPAHRVIDTRHHVLLPGLIDAHSHAGHSLMRGLAATDPKLWLEACQAVTLRGSSSGFWRSEARLSALERMMAGITTCVSVLGANAAATRCDDPAHGIAHCGGMADIGIRSILAVGPCGPPFPSTFASWDGGRCLEFPVSFERQLETMQALVETCHGRGRSQIALMMPPIPIDLAAASDTAAMHRQGRLVMELQHRDRLLFHQDGHGSGSIEMADRVFGLLGPDSFVAPGHDLTPGDIATLERLNVAVVHTPASLSCLHGACPVTALLDRGITVALGSDGAAPEHGADPFRLMLLARRAAQHAARDEAVLPPGKALEMMTIDAARALRMDREIGSLEAGKKADIIAIDLRRPHLAPRTMNLWRVVCFAETGDVATVVVDGEVLMEARVPAGIDTDAVLDEAQLATELMLDRTGLRSALAEPKSLWGQTRSKTLRAPTGARRP